MPLVGGRETANGREELFGSAAGIRDCAASRDLQPAAVCLAQGASRGSAWRRGRLRFRAGDDRTRAAKEGFRTGWRAHGSGEREWPQSHRRARRGCGSAAADYARPGNAAMIPIPTGVRVWLATGHPDMRCGFPSLALRVQEILKKDPLGGHIFAFAVKRRSPEDHLA